MKHHAIFTWILLPLIALVGGVTTVLAIDTSSALYTTNFQFLNLGLSRSNIPLAQQISGSALIDDGFMGTNALNAVIHEGPVQVAGMPPNNRIIVEGAILDDGGSFVEFTNEARNSIELDIALLPVSPAVNDAHYFGCDNPCRIITVNIGQEGIGDWNLSWEYFNGTTFVTASNVDDRTNAFKSAGPRTVSFDMPTDFATTTITGSSVDAFWVRARVTSVSTSSQQAVGTQEFYENGQWWMWGSSLNINEEILYTLSFGGPSLVTNHQIFPGTAGIVTPDNATIELGDDYSIHWEGNVSFVTGSGVSCIVCKGTTSGSPIRLFVSNNVTREITLEVNGGGSTTLSVSGIPIATAGTTASHVIDVFSDGTDVSLAIEGVGTRVGTARILTDNGDSYTWMNNGAATFGNKMYLIASSTSLALDVFDDQSDWDTGVKSGTESQAGQPDLSRTFIVDEGTADGFWVETAETFFGTGTTTPFGGNTVFGGITNVFHRFRNIDIDQGATVLSAKIIYTPNTSDTTTTVDSRISAIAADNASAPFDFTSAENAIRTTAFVDWNNVPSFLHGSHANPTTNDSVDITSVVQEIFDRSGWASGNALVIYNEDNGSGAADRRPASFENHEAAVKLEIVLGPAPILTDDFIRLTFNTLTPNSWTTTGTGSGGAVSTDTDGATHLKHSARVIGPSNIGDRILFQDLVASPGQVWSASIDISTHFSNDNGSHRFRLKFLDAAKATLQDNLVTATNDGSPRHQVLTINNVTAPVLTAFVRIQGGIEGCSLSNCVNNAFPLYLDEMLACICNPAPTFPDATNLVVNPSFENIHQTTGTWTSPTLSPTNTNVQSSSVNFDVHLPSTNTLLVETSIDNQASFQTVLDGGSIPGINEGDDLSGSTLHIRATLTGPGPSTGILPLLFVVILDEVGANSTALFYELRSTPGVLIPDLSPNTNNGTMSYPVQLSGIFTASTPLKSTRIPLSQPAAIGAGDFAASVTGSAADLNLFGEDDGSFLPGGQVLIDAAAIGNIPITALWVFLVLIVGVAAGAVIYNATKPNHLPASIVLSLAVVLAAAIGGGIIPGWVPFVTILMFTAWNILRSRLPI